MFTVANIEFSEWLRAEIEKRGMTQADLARAAGVSKPHVSLVLNGERNPGMDFLEGVAKALRLPIDEVYRVAGILPPVTKADALTELGTHLLKQLPVEDRERMVEQLQALVAWQEAQKRKTRET